MDHVAGCADDGHVVLDCGVPKEGVGVGHDAQGGVPLSGGKADQFVESCEPSSGDRLRLLDRLRDGVIECAVPRGPSPDEIVDLLDLALDVRCGMRKEKEEPVEPGRVSAQKVHLDDGHARHPAPTPSRRP